MTMIFKIQPHKSSHVALRDLSFGECFECSMPGYTGTFMKVETSASQAQGQVNRRNDERGCVSLERGTFHVISEKTPVRPVTLTVSGKEFT